MRWILLLTVLAATPIAACGFDCHHKCEEAKPELIRVALALGDPVDENMCENDSIARAETCTECRQAFRDEFGVEPVGGDGFCE